MVRAAHGVETTLHLVMVWQMRAHSKYVVRDEQHRLVLLGDLPSVEGSVLYDETAQQTTTDNHRCNPKVVVHVGPSGVDVTYEDHGYSTPLQEYTKVVWSAEKSEPYSALPAAQ